MAHKIQDALRKLREHKLVQSSRGVRSNEPLSEKEFHEMADVLRGALEEIDDRLNRLEQKVQRNP